MLDPACPDITGRVLEALGAHALPGSHPAVKRGVDFLLRNQQPDGSWYGRWGVAYIYGTCFALRGLRAAHYDDREAPVLRAGEWLRSIQNADGGWGESCSSYDQGCFVPAESTPSQTAWALMGLIAGGDTNSLSVHHGIEYLLDTQRPDGGWDEELATGTGFPKVFYLNYHYYRLYFPLIALSEFYVGQARSLQRPRSPPPGLTYEISPIHDRRHGRIHFQEQNASAPGVAERRSRRAGHWPTRSASCTASGQPRQSPAASHDPQALPAGDDAGAAARLQPHLHRLRPHPRVRVHHYRARAARRMPGGGG
jgi:hypothetical protein